MQPPFFVPDMQNLFAKLFVSGSILVPFRRNINLLVF